MDYEATAEELRALFAPCGTINRITIPTGPGGRAKGYAYIEFDDKVGVDKALAYDDNVYQFFIALNLNSVLIGVNT